MFDSSDVQSVFSGNIAEEWEKKCKRSIASTLTILSHFRGLL